MPNQWLKKRPSAPEPALTQMIGQHRRALPPATPLPVPGMAAASSLVGTALPAKPTNAPSKPGVMAKPPALVLPPGAGSALAQATGTASALGSAPAPNKPGVMAKPPALVPPPPALRPLPGKPTTVALQPDQQLPLKQGESQATQSQGPLPLPPGDKLLPQVPPASSAPPMIDNITDVKQQIQMDYGINLDNMKGIEAARRMELLCQMAQGTGSQSVSLETLQADAEKQIKAGSGIEDLAKTGNWKDWGDDELRSLWNALRNYWPLLRSYKGSDKKPLKSLSRASLGVDVNASGTIWDADRDMAGVNFSFDHNITIYDKARKKGRDFEKQSQMFRGTIEHELSHALIENLPAKVKDVDSTMIEKFWQEMKFWESIDASSYGRDSGDKKVGYKDPDFSITKTRDAATKDEVEPPITDYGMKSAQEDLADSMMFFFENPSKLKQKCPKRFNFIMGNIAKNLDPDKVKAAQEAKVA
jgi:hypothetical protein